MKMSVEVWKALITVKMMEKVVISSFKEIGGTNGNARNAWRDSLNGIDRTKEAILTWLQR